MAYFLRIPSLIDGEEEGQVYYDVLSPLARPSGRNQIPERANYRRLLYTLGLAHVSMIKPMIKSVNEALYVAEDYN